MAYSTANPPRLLMSRFGGVSTSTNLSTVAATQPIQGGNLWYYASTNLTTDLTASNFFSDGWTRGMRAGDLVMGQQFSSQGSSVQTFFGSIASASTAGASFSTGSLITSTFS